LELLNQRPIKSWTSAELVKELRASTTLVNQALSHFFKGGLITEKEGQWRIADLNSEQQAILMDVATLYRQRPIATISLIRETDPIQGLADAFKVRRDIDE
jgi:hypothetical protein